MVSKRLIGVWASVDFCMLVAGVISIILSIVWRAPNPLMNMVFSPTDLTVGMVLGIALLATFAFSIGAIIQANHVTIGLVILNWILIADALGILIIGSFIWVFTLGERANFDSVYGALDDSTRIEVQDKLKCCGYFNLTDIITYGGNTCPDAATAAAINAPCVGPITNFADASLNLTFTTVYGFMAIVICLFLASLCVIKKRQEGERFKKIDAKRGGRGFV